MGLFGKKLTPTEQVREWQRRLRREQRMMDREIRQLNQETKKVEKSLREAAKRGDSGSVQILGKEISVARAQIGRFHANKVRIERVWAGVAEDGWC